LFLIGRKSVASRLLDSLEIDDSEIRDMGWKPPFTVEEGIRLTVATARGSIR